MTGAGPAADLRAVLAIAAPRLPFAPRIVVHDTVGSTNDEAARLAGLGAEEGTIVVADAQSGGRGRSGRSWFSPPGSGVYVSVLLRPGAERNESGPVEWLRLITLAAGVAVAEAIRTSTALPVELKWPNDVVISDARGPRSADRRWRKVAGILAEASAVGGAVQYVVVGMGINVGAASLPVAVAGRATSIETELGRPIERASVLVETLTALWSRYEDLRQGRAGVVLARWRALSPTAEGARVELVHEGRAREGTTAGLAPDGALSVRTDAGLEPVISGDLTWI